MRHIHYSILNCQCFLIYLYFHYFRFQLVLFVVLFQHLYIFLNILLLILLVHFLFHLYLHQLLLLQQSLINLNPLYLFHFLIVQIFQPLYFLNMLFDCFGLYFQHLLLHNFRNYVFLHLILLALFLNFLF